jgi:hypothetical protein
MSELGRALARLSASEMVAALGVRGGPPLLRRGLELPFRAASRSLGETLAELDSALGARGLPEAAARALGRCGVALRVSGTAVGRGPCLVLANHPGAYDALALMWALGRQDLLVLAADRAFLRALPGLSPHLCFVAEGPGARAGALKRGLSWLRGGGALLHFPAGQIEPDADFEPDPARWLQSWQPGVAALLAACARVEGQVLLAGVRGVHSRRAKQALINRWAEQRGLTTLSPLLQLWRRLHDVETRVHLRLAAPARELSPLSAAEQTEQLRAQLLSAVASA